MRSDLNLEDLETLGLIRLLEVIGEAARAVSTVTQAAHPEVPWAPMTGMRNRLIHGYFNVNLDTVWDTIQSDVPNLVPLLESLLRSLDRKG